MPWLLSSPGHQHPRYQLCRIGKYISFGASGKLSSKGLSQKNMLFQMGKPKFKLRIVSEETEESQIKKERQRALTRIRMRRYRANKKDDAAYQKKEQSRKRGAKPIREVSVEDQEKRREQNRLRQQRFREKNKNNEARVDKTQTRGDIAKQRQAWRERKRQSRKDMSAQKRRWVLEKDRVYHSNKRLKVDISSESEENGTEKNEHLELLGKL